MCIWPPETTTLHSAPLHGFGLSHLRRGDCRRRYSFLQRSHRLCSQTRRPEATGSSRGFEGGLEELIRREIKLHESDGQGHLIFKMNALDPPRLHGG